MLPASASASAAAAQSSAATPASSTAPLLDFTLEKLTALQRLQLTLHAPPRSAESGAVAPLTAPRCAIDTTYPYKPTLLLRWPAPSSDLPPVQLSVPLSARVDLRDAAQPTRVSMLADGAVISMHMKQDLAEVEHEDSFPTAREIDPASYTSVYCRQCGCPVLAARPSSAPAWRVKSLPSEHWSELTELWFCHTAGNAHVATLAQTRIAVARGTVLVGRLDLRVHNADLHAHHSWRQHPTIVDLVHKLEAGTAATGAAATAAAHAQQHQQHQPQRHSLDSALSSDEVWSPLPCSVCHVTLGSVLLSVRASTDPAEAVQLAPSAECRLLKHMLSNCFRQRERAQYIQQQQQQQQQQLSAHSSSAPDQHHMQVDDDAERKAPPPPPLVASPPVPASVSSCLCASYGPSPIAGLALTCSNVFVHYTLETRLSEELLQRFEGRPASRFLVDCEGDGGGMCVRLLVTHWHHYLSSTLIAAFPFTPVARQSSLMLPVLALEFAVHEGGEEDAAVQRWIHTQRQPQTQHTAHAHTHTHASHSSHAHPEPPHIERLTLPTSDVSALMSLLRSRSLVWPASARQGTQPGMQRSCLLKLTKNAVL